MQPRTAQHPHRRRHGVDADADPPETESDELPEVPPVRSGYGSRCFVRRVPGEVQEHESARGAEQVQQPRPAGELEPTERRCDEQHRRRHEQHQGCPGGTVEGLWFHSATLAGASRSAASCRCDSIRRHILPLTRILRAERFHISFGIPEARMLGCSHAPRHPFIPVHCRRPRAHRLHCGSRSTSHRITTTMDRGCHRRGVDPSLRLGAHETLPWAANPVWLATRPADHGAQVASVALGSSDDAFTLSDNAPDLLDVRVSSAETPATPQSIASGLTHATIRGADLIVVALSTGDDSPLLRQAVQHADTAGAVVVSSLRNELVGTVSYPADYPTVLAISSIDSAARRSITSPRDGDLSDLGVDVLAQTADGRSQLTSGTSVATASAARSIMQCADPDHSAEQVLKLAERSGLKDDRHVPVLRCPERNKR